MSVYDRQDRIEGINKGLKLLIIGAGGIGFWAAKFFAMSGIEEMTIFDPDTLEESNLNRLDLTYDSIGKNKAIIVRDMIEVIRPDCKVRAYPFPLKEHLMPRDFDVMVDCTDNFKAQCEHEALAKKSGKKYVKFGYDGTRVSISNSIPRWDTTDEEVDGYRVTPSWVIPSVVVAAMGVGAVMKYHGKELGADISQFYFN